MSLDETRPKHDAWPWYVPSFLPYYSPFRTSWCF